MKVIGFPATPRPFPVPVNILYDFDAFVTINGWTWTHHY